MKQKVVCGELTAETRVCTRLRKAGCEGGEQHRVEAAGGERNHTWFLVFF